MYFYLSLNTVMNTVLISGALLFVIKTQITKLRVLFKALGIGERGAYLKIHVKFKLLYRIFLMQYIVEL